MTRLCSEVLCVMLTKTWCTYHTGLCGQGWPDIDQHMETHPTAGLWVQEQRVFLRSVFLQLQCALSCYRDWVCWHLWHLCPLLMHNIFRLLFPTFSELPFLQMEWTKTNNLRFLCGEARYSHESISFAMWNAVYLLMVNLLKLWCQFLYSAVVGTTTQEKITAL